MRTTTETNTALIKSMLKLIRSYREIEQKPLIYGFTWIKKSVLYKDEGDNQFRHLCGHWKSKKKEFGSFFLNSSYRRMIQIMQSWGVKDPADQEYIERCENDPTFHIFNSPPVTVEAFRKVILFFENHGIDEKPARGITLTKLPSKIRRFGNSKNWGAYILSHPDPESIILQILENYEG